MICLGARRTGRRGAPGSAAHAGRRGSGDSGVTVEVTGILGIYSDPGHIVAYTDGEIRQEYEVILLGRPVSGTPAANDEASDAGWFTPEELRELDIHPTQWRQIRDYLDAAWPHIDQPGPANRRSADQT